MKIESKFFVSFFFSNQQVLFFYTFDFFFFLFVVVRSRKNLKCLLKFLIECKKWLSCVFKKV